MGVKRSVSNVLDVAARDKVPRKGGPGIMRSDLLIINKIDLAPHVGVSLEMMDREAKKMRGDRVTTTPGRPFSTTKDCKVFTVAFGSQGSEMA